MTADYERGWRDAVEAAAKECDWVAKRAARAPHRETGQRLAESIRSLTPPAPSAATVESGTVCECNDCASAEACGKPSPHNVPASPTEERCPVRCENCKHFDREKPTDDDGWCQVEQDYVDPNGACSLGAFRDDMCHACGGTGRTKGGTR